MPSLLPRLKERKLFQWALAYLAGAWLIFQGIEVLAEPWNLSEAIQRTIHVLLGIGFLVTLVLAWYHGEKGRQRASGVELLILAGILVIAGAAVAMLGRGGEEGDEATAEQREAVATPADRATIAVLPFENLSPAADDAYFTDGIHDEVISRLVKVTALRVTSRTSVMEYKAEARNVREIARELGVRNIVEGTVRRAGDRVRITAQLIDAEADAHLWAENYERELRDIFAIQSEVAEQIVAALQVSLTPSERAQIEARPTENMEAYDYYLRGNQYAVGDEASRRIAVEMYERAVELDPSFALAYAKLSVTHGQVYWFYYDHSESRRMQAKEAADRVIALGPESPEAHEALGYYYLHGRDYERAAAEFNKILSKQPANSEALAALSSVRRRQGDFEGAVSLQKRALELDPRNSNMLISLAASYWVLRDYEQAAARYELAMALRPDWPDPYSFYAYLCLQLVGADSARAVLEQASRRVGTADPFYQWVWTRVELCDRDLDRALQRVEQAPDVLEDQWYYLPRALLFAEAHDLLGDSDLARGYYDSALAFLDPQVLEQPDDWRRHSAQGIAYAGLGRSEEAIREGRLAVELMPVARDALDGPWALEWLARIYALVGEYDAAVEQLDRLLSIPSRVSVPLLRIDPTWDALRDNPRFQALLAQYE